MFAPSDSMGYQRLNGAAALPSKESCTGSEIGGSIEKGIFRAGRGLPHIGEKREQLTLLWPTNDF